ncbi:O-antigen ligase family protein [bacterium]|nr:O-antigen ligase family protein [bacterium]
MLAKIRKIFSVALFLLAFGAIWPAAFELAPLDPVYCFFYAVALFFVFAAAYYVPQKALYILAFILPFSAAPSRLLNIGAHQPIIFFALIFSIGFWANRLVTGKNSSLDKSFKLPLLLLFMVGLSSAAWTVARYGGLFTGFKTPFFYDRIINTDGRTASEAARITLLYCFLFLLFPAVVWTVASIFGDVKREERKPYLKKLLRAVTFGLLPVLALAFLQHKGSYLPKAFQDIGWLEAGRVSGGMSDPNALGLFIALYIPLALYFIWVGNVFDRLLFGITVIPAFLAMTFSGSRSSLLFLFLFALIFFSALVFQRFRSKKPTLVQIVGAAGIVMLFLIFLVASPRLKLDTNSRNPVVARIARQLRRLERDKGMTLTDRRELQWKQAWRIWKEYPIGGVGLGAFPLEVVNYNREAGDETPMDNPWNQYLTWGAELGFAGAAVFVWLIVLIFLKAFKSEKDKLFLLFSAMLLSFMVISFFGTHLNAPEAAALTAFVLAVFMSLLKEGSNEPLRFRSLLVAALFFVVFNAVYAYGVFGKLGGEERRERFDLPSDFGLYKKETWIGGGFNYRWSAPKGGMLISVPENERVLKLRLAAIRETQVAVTFWYDGEMLDTIILKEPGWQEIKLNIFPWLSDKALLCFAVSSPFKPEGESRELGLAFACDYEFTDEYMRQAQGIVGVENTEHGRLVIIRNGLSWQPSEMSTKVHLDFEMILSKPLEAKHQDYSLYLGSKLLEDFSLPFDGKTHTLEIALPEGDRSALSLRAKKLLPYKPQGGKETLGMGARIRAIGDF